MAVTTTKKRHSLTWPLAPVDSAGLPVVLDSRPPIGVRPLGNRDRGIAIVRIDVEGHLTSDGIEVSDLVDFDIHITAARRAHARVEDRNVDDAGIAVPALRVVSEPRPVGLIQILANLVVAIIELLMMARRVPDDVRAAARAETVVVRVAVFDDERVQVDAVVHGWGAAAAA